MSLSIARSSGLAALASLALVAGAQAAAVKVSFIEPEKFTDAGDRPAEREATMKSFEAHLAELGTRLPADLTLNVELLDVDLAGRMEWVRNGMNMRIVRGRADWPRISLRYTLLKDGQVQASGTDKIDDMNYTMQMSSARANESMYFEKRLLEEWFQARFGDRIAAKAP